MALFIEYSPAVQEVPAETQHSQMLYAKDVDGSGQASTTPTLRTDYYFLPLCVYWASSDVAGG
jgi:hypothetical protein